MKKSPNYKVEVLTGIRPTADLTIANYLGAIAPIVELQKKMSTIVFVADLHAITDKEPKNIKENIYKVVADYIALGIDPKKTKIYLQSDIGSEILTLTAFFSRLVSVAELLRVPTLKDKIKKNKEPETASALLLLYPVMMAADILINKAKYVPVGEDQLPHIEMTRLIARRFNKKYKEVFPIPQVLQVESVRILSLKGEGKMSKTNPSGAIFLTDDKKTVVNKIKSAETAFEGLVNEKLKSLILIGKGLAKTKSDQEEIDFIIEEHKKGKRVMKEFKEILIKIVQNFLDEFQSRRREIIKDPYYISSVLNEGTKIAKRNSSDTLDEVLKAMKFS
jgi:tryptophanyl-tRNA synthetase